MEGETTIVALFDNHADAERARAALLNVNIDESRINITRHRGYADDLHPELADSGSGMWGFLGALKSVFVPDMDSSTYAEGIRRGGCLLWARVENRDADRACEIVESFGPVDIEERERHWRESGWDGYREDSAPYSNEEAAAERTRYQVAADGLAGPGAAVPRASVRRYPMGGEVEPRMSAEEANRSARAAAGTQGYGEPSTPDKLTDAMDDEILAADQGQRPDAGGMPSGSSRMTGGGRPAERMRDDELPRAARESGEQAPGRPRRS